MLHNFLKKLRRIFCTRCKVASDFSNYKDLFRLGVSRHVMNLCGSAAISGLTAQLRLTWGEKVGYLKSITRVVGGKVRKYYQATAEGKLVLERSKKRIKEPVDEVLEEQESG